jgi:hypothetical protein
MKLCLAIQRADGGNSVIFNPFSNPINLTIYLHDQIIGHDNEKST